MVERLWGGGGGGGGGVLLCKVSSPSATSSLSRRPDPGRVFLFVFAGERNTERGERRNRAGLQVPKSKCTKQRSGEAVKKRTTGQTTPNQNEQAPCVPGIALSLTGLFSLPRKKNLLCVSDHTSDTL